MSEEEIIEIVRTRLSIHAKRSREYTGDIDGSGELYRDFAIAQLLLDGEVFSETYI